jgi:hypothetical protein
MKRKFPNTDFYYLTAFNAPSTLPHTAHPDHVAGTNDYDMISALVTVERLPGVPTLIPQTTTFRKLND